MNTGDHHVEVKAEPMAILSTTHEEVPSSGVNVTEFITTQDGDLATLGHGISTQFMFSPDPSGGQDSGAGSAAAAGGGGGQAQQQHQHQQQVIQGQQAQPQLQQQQHVQVWKSDTDFKSQYISTMRVAL